MLYSFVSLLLFAVSIHAHGLEETIFSLPTTKQTVRAHNVISDDGVMSSISTVNSIFWTGRSIDGTIDCKIDLMGVTEFENTLTYLNYRNEKTEVFYFRDYNHCQEFVATDEGSFPGYLYHSRGDAFKHILGSYHSNEPTAPEQTSAQ